MKPLTQLLGNLKVSGKIALGMGAILVLLLIVGSVTLVGLTSVQDDFAAYRRLAAQTEAASNAEINLLAARMSANKFIVGGSDADAEATRAAAEAAHAAMLTGLDLIDDEETKEKVQRTDADILAYADSFRLLLPLRDERNALVDRLNAIGGQIENDLTTLMQQERSEGSPDAVYSGALILRNLLLARLEAHRFLVENAEARIDAFRSQIEELKLYMQAIEMTAALPSSKRIGEKLAAAIGEYTESFEAITRATFERNAIIAGQLDTIGPLVAEELDRFKADNEAAQDQLGDEAENEIRRTLLLAIGVSAIALLIGIGAAVITGRGIARPVVTMTLAMRRLAEGDKSVEIPAQGRRDEVGQMAAAVEVFRQKMIEADRLEAEQASEREARERRAQQIERLTHEFDEAVSSVLSHVAAATSQMQSTSASMSATAEETNRQALTVAAASEQASANVQSVASASDQLSTSIEEISRQVAQSASISHRASEDAERTNDQVVRLSAAAQRIGDVVSLIQDIAAQTNLLALNATIEAARAGDAGKGFPVVASEVKTLANQTAKATEEIAQQIGEIQGETSGAVAAIEAIGRTISEINQIASGIASAVEEQNAATREIARNVQEAARGTQEVSSNISGVTEAAGETGTAAEQVHASAANLAEQSAHLRRAVEDFLAGVRAA